MDYSREYSMVELWLVVEPQANNTLYWAKEFFYSASFSVKELNEIRETEFESPTIFKHSV